MLPINLSSEMSVFANTIIKQKYAHDIETGKESWPQIAYRVAYNVLSPIGVSVETILEMASLIESRKFIPGGRYLYAAGRPFHQVQNCLEGDTRVVTRYGVKTLKAAGARPTLMTSEGHWVRSEIRSFGVQPLRKITLTRQGVEKILYATPEHSWRVAKNIYNGRPVNKISKTTDELRSGDKLWQVFGFGISRTPVSQVGVQHGIVYGDGNVPQDEWGFNTANVRLCGEKDAHLLPYFAGYSQRPLEQDTEISGLPRRFKSKPSLEDDRSYLLGWLAGYFAADGCVSQDGVVRLSSADRESLVFVRDVCYLLGIGTFGICQDDRVSNLTNEQHTQYSIVFMRDTLTPEFFLIPEHRDRFVKNPGNKQKFWNVVSVEETDRVEEVFCAIVPETHEFVLEDNILTGNCVLNRVEDSREGWAEHLHKASMALMTGAGLGVVYSDVRPKGAPIRKTGGTATGPIALMKMTNECGRGIMQGGSRRSALWAGLHWNHGDIFDFITVKEWSPEIKAMKEKDFNAYAPMDGTNISVILDDAFFEAYHNDEHRDHALACNVYQMTVESMLRTGEPGFSIDVKENTGENLRNACTEITSYDDSDICNLGSINMARISSLDEMARVVELGTMFLLAGTVYSDVPYQKISDVRDKNRRLGLGLMGLHEWLLLRGYKYEGNPELEQYMLVYKESTYYANHYARLWNISVPVKTRAIAPTGTIGIVGETTTGIEPIFCVCYKRRYLDGTTWKYQYVVDPTAKRLIDLGVKPEDIEDAYVLARDPEKRIAFQAWLQAYVDHGISSTLNIPAWNTEYNNDGRVAIFGDMLMGYLPKLRGITVYPDGARGGQPLTPVRYATAVKHEGQIFFEAADICDLTKSGGTCGS